MNSGFTIATDLAEPEGSTVSAAKNIGLVVDDERITMTVVTNLLTRLGYDVHAAQSGTEAVRRFAIERPQIVVADYNMHPMTGLDLWAMFNRASAGYVPFVLMTTAPMRDQLEKSSRSLPVIITKPFNADLLLRAVRFARGETGPEVVQVG